MASAWKKKKSAKLTKKAEEWLRMFIEWHSHSSPTSANIQHPGSCRDRLARCGAHGALVLQPGEGIHDLEDLGRVSA